MPSDKKAATAFIILILWSCLFILGLQLHPAHAQTNATKLITPTLQINIPTVSFTKGSIANGIINVNYLGDYIAGLYKYLIGISTTIAIVMIMIGGLQWALSGGTIIGEGGKEQAGKAKTRIKNAVTGLILLMSTYIILYTVNPNLLSLRTPELENIPLVQLPNETGTNLDDYKWEVAETVGNGIGWNNVPIFSQKLYASTPYGICGTIKTSGCGVASFAMVASYFSSQNIAPDQVARRFADEGYRACPSNATAESDGTCPACMGTKAAAFYQSSYMQELGLTAKTISTTQASIQEALENGELVIISYKTKSGGGHYVVLTGVGSDGKVLVNDPWGGVKQRRSWSQITSTIKSATAIGK